MLIIINMSLLPDAHDLAMQTIADHIIDEKNKGRTSIKLEYAVSERTVKKLQEKNYRVHITRGDCDHHFCRCGDSTLISW